MLYYNKEAKLANTEEERKELIIQAEQIYGETWKYHHTSWAKGYVPAGKTYIAPYKGKFGMGWKEYRHSKISSVYCEVDYYLVYEE